MSAYEINVLTRMADGLRAEVLNWAMGGGTLLLIALVVIGLFAVIRAVCAYE